MAFVRATCPDCGDIAVRSRAVTVRIDPDPAPASYRFVCPGCHEAVVRTASPRVVALLVAADAPTVVHRPAHGAARGRRGPITAADLVGLRRALARPDWLDTLLAAGPAAPD
jgi:hypothetical protein